MNPPKRAVTFHPSINWKKEKAKSDARRIMIINDKRQRYVEERRREAALRLETDLFVHFLRAFSRKELEMLIMMDVDYMATVRSMGRRLSVKNDLDEFQYTLWSNLPNKGLVRLQTLFSEKQDYRMDDRMLQSLFTHPRLPDSIVDPMRFLPKLYGRNAHNKFFKGKLRACMVPLKLREEFGCFLRATYEACWTKSVNTPTEQPQKARPLIRNILKFRRAVVQSR